MSRLIKSLILIALSVVFVSTSLAAEVKKQNVAIIGTKAVEDDWGTLATGEGYLLDYFLKMKRFNVIERSLLAKIMDEQKIQRSGLIDEATAVRIGALAGAQYLVLLNLSSITQPLSIGHGGAAGGGAGMSSMLSGMKMKVMMGSPAMAVNVRIVNVQDAKILYNKNASRESPTPINKDEESKQKTDGEKIVNKFMIDIMKAEIGPDLQAKFPLQGYVIEVRSDKEIEIDLGQDMDIKKGTELLVIKMGADRKHPVTGKVIPGSRRELGRMKVKSVDGPESSVCETVNGGPFVVGQVVEVIPGSIPTKTSSAEQQSKETDDAASSQGKRDDNTGKSGSFSDKLKGLKGIFGY